MTVWTLGCIVLDIFVNHYAIWPLIPKTIFIKHCRVEIIAFPFVLFHRDGFFLSMFPSCKLIIWWWLHRWSTSNSVSTHCWCIVDASLVYRWSTVDPLLIHRWSIIDPSLIHCWCNIYSYGGDCAICQNCRLSGEFNTHPFFRRLDRILNIQNINIAQPTGHTW